MKNKKTIIVLAVLALLGVVGVTYAYFTSTETFTNLFQTKPYSTEIEETFTSPDNWTPGTETPKTVKVTNTGEVDIVARVKIEQTWTSKNSSEEGDLPLKQNGEDVAILNFPEENNWEYEDGEGDYEEGWYYYNAIIEPEGESTPFLKSVTFNSKVTAGTSCTTTTTNGVTKDVCTSTGTGYDGAKYKLVITVETLQADAKDDVWGIEKEDLEKED